MNNHTYTIYNSLVKRASGMIMPIHVATGVPGSQPHELGGKLRLASTNLTGTRYPGSMTPSTDPGKKDTKSPINTLRTNPTTGGTLIPRYTNSDESFVGGPNMDTVELLQRYGLPVLPVSSGIIDPLSLSLSDYETLQRMILRAEKYNLIRKEKNRQNLDEYFARLTALNDANAAAGRPLQNVTALGIYAPYADKSDRKLIDEALHRMYRDTLASSAAYAAAANGTPYNPAELDEVTGFIPYTHNLRLLYKIDASRDGLRGKDAWRFIHYGIKPHITHPYERTLYANFRKKSLGDYSEEK